MNQKRVYKTYTQEFKKEAVALVIDQGYSVAYRVTTKRELTDVVAPNLVNMNFNPTGPNQVWAGDITHLKIGEGWMYLRSL